MTWFLAFVVVAVMGAVAVVASGRGGSMAETFDDRPDSRVQADGPLSAADLRSVRFSTAFRGYRMSEVDSLLDRLAAEMAPAPDPLAAERMAERPDDERTTQERQAGDAPATEPTDAPATEPAAARGPQHRRAEGRTEDGATDDGQR